jgi:peptide/nickel transport system substrate-binding protein
VKRHGIVGWVFVLFSLAAFAFSQAEQNIVRVVLESAPPHLDNHISTARLTTTVTDPINVFLVTQNEKLEIVPYLAKSWEQPDPTTLRFFLHEGVKFHNGRELVADDVKKSIERVQNPDTASPLRSDFAVVKTINVIDDYTVELILERPFAPLFTQLARLAIMPMEEVEAKGSLRTEPVGAGPYRFVEWKQDQEIVLEKFEDFTLGEVQNNGVIFKFYPEYAAGLAALTSGDADLHLWVKPTDIPRLQSDPTMTLIPNALNGSYYIAFNLLREPWGDAKLREAVLYGVDRNIIAQIAFGGFAEPAYSPVSTSDFYFDESLVITQDLERAKTLASEVGWMGEATLVAPNTPVEAPMAEIVQNQLQALGLNIRLEILDVPAYIDRVFVNKDFDLTVVGDSSFGDPDYLLRQYFIPDGESNVMGYDNPEIAALIEEAATLSDPAERKAIYDQIYPVIQKDAPLVYLVQEVRHGAMRQPLTGVVFKPNNTYVFDQATFGSE